MESFWLQSGVGATPAVPFNPECGAWQYMHDPEMFPWTGEVLLGDRSCEPITSSACARAVLAQARKITTKTPRRKDSSQEKGSPVPAPDS